MNLDERYYSIYHLHRELKRKIKVYGFEDFVIALERGEGEVAVKTLQILPKNFFDDNLLYVERVVKTMLWAFGGYKLFLKGDLSLCEAIEKIYSTSGKRKFDVEFMSDVYQRDFLVSIIPGEMPEEKTKPQRVGGNLKGNRIGFDAGGSDRKVTACIDGEVVFEKETLWLPKLNSDPAYHKAGIIESIDMGVEALGGKVDAIGVSSAGIVIENQLRVASLFIKVPKSMYKEKVFDIYKNLKQKYNCPVKVANDGDVAALAGAEFLKQGRVMGIALGTSQAAGYIDSEMNLIGYLNELAFVPVDVNPEARLDEWSLDAGVGCKYHSQDAAIHLAEEAGIVMEADLTLAEKLKAIQSLANKKDARALAVFIKMGEYLANSIMWYKEFYDIEKIVLYGRVVSGLGGEVLIEKAQDLLNQYDAKVELVLPDEMTRRLGQSFAAAML